MTTEDEIIIRSPLPGEFGWIIQVHGQYYAETNGWYGEFECIVAKIVVDYLSAESRGRQACFIAELNGQRVGCIMLTESSHSEGKLRVMFVSADARGKGIGTLLIKAVLNKAETIGYKTLSLWTSPFKVARWISCNYLNRIEILALDIISPKSYSTAYNYNLWRCKECSAQCLSDSLKKALYQLWRVA